MITFLKEIIDDDFKRIVFVPTYNMDVGVCIVDICVECVYTMHFAHVYVQCTIVQTYIM